MRSIKTERRSMLCSVSPARRDILQQAGIDLRAQALDLVRNRREALQGASVPRVLRKMLTSELAFRSDGLESVFGKEYARRLGLLGLYRTQVRELYSQEKALAAADTEHRAGVWTGRSFFSPGTTPGSLPPQATLTLSELLLLSGEATAIRGIYGSKTSGKACPAPVRRAAALAASFVGGPERYLKEFRRRTEAFGWDEAQQTAYRANEFLLIAALADIEVGDYRPWTAGFSARIAVPRMKKQHNN